MNCETYIEQWEDALLARTRPTSPAWHAHGQACNSCRTRTREDEALDTLIAMWHPRTAMTAALPFKPVFAGPAADAPTAPARWMAMMPASACCAAMGIVLALGGMGFEPRGHMALRPLGARFRPVVAAPPSIMLAQVLAETRRAPWLMPVSTGFGWSRETPPADVDTADASVERAGAAAISHWAPAAPSLAPVSDQVRQAFGFLSRSLPAVPAKDIDPAKSDKV